MSKTKQFSVLGPAWESRIDALEQAGFITSRRTIDKTDTIVGLSLFALRFWMRRQEKNSKLYSYTAKPGETVRIKVMRGNETLADATIGS